MTAIENSPAPQNDEAGEDGFDGFTPRRPAKTVIVGSTGRMYYATSEGVASYMLHMAFKLTCYALMPILAIAVFDVWQSRYAYNEGMRHRYIGGSI